MRCNTLSLYESRSDVALKLYLQDFNASVGPGHLRPAVMILPGGGFSGHLEQEGEPVALCFLALGYQAFVLEYSVGVFSRLPNPIIDAALALATVKQNAEQWGVDPDRIFLVGLGSGGFVALGLACHWDNERILGAVSRQILQKVESYSALKPSGVVLAHPLLDVAEVLDNLMRREEMGQQQSIWLRQVLFGSGPIGDLWTFENFIQESTPPMSVWRNKDYLFDCPLATGRILERSKLVEHEMAYHEYGSTPNDIRWAMDVDRWIRSRGEG